MKFITDIEAAGDPTAAYLYWDEDRYRNKLILVNNKKAGVKVRFEVLNNVIWEVDLGSYQTFGINVEEYMKSENIWVYLTYHGDQTGCIGYHWSTGTVVLC